MVDRIKRMGSSSQAYMGMGEVRDKLIRASKIRGKNVLDMAVLSHFIGKGESQVG
jgi:hypothetical protein